MGKFRRFFLRPARKPFWEKAGYSVIPGLNAALLCLLCLGIAFGATAMILNDAPAGFGYSANKTGNPWTDLFLLILAGPFWVIAAVSGVVAAISLLWAAASGYGTRLAKRWVQRKEEEQ